MPHPIPRRTRTDGRIPILSVAFDPVRRFSAEPTASGTTPNTGAVIAEKSPEGSNAASSFCQSNRGLRPPFSWRHSVKTGVCLRAC